MAITNIHFSSYKIEPKSVENCSHINHCDFSTSLGKSFVAVDALFSGRNTKWQTVIYSHMMIIDIKLNTVEANGNRGLVH